MNEEELRKWESDAFDALIKVYSIDDVRIIMDWFEQIRARAEYDLLGHERFDAMVIYTREFPNIKFDLYKNMMSRLWRYADLILEENKQYARN